MERDKNASRTFVSNNEKSRVKVVRIDLQQTTDEIRLVYGISCVGCNEQQSVEATVDMCSVQFWWGKEEEGALLASARAKRTYLSIYVFILGSVYRDQLLAMAIIIWHSSNEPSGIADDSHSVACVHSFTLTVPQLLRCITSLSSQSYHICLLCQMPQPRKREDLSEMFVFILCVCVVYIKTLHGCV